MVLILEMNQKYKLIKKLITLLMLVITVSSAFAEDEVYDPIEPFNRGIFWFNDKFDINLAEPVARGYDKVVPEVVQDSVNNVFDTLSYPSYLVSDLVQLKVSQALDHTGRFLLNATLGIAGIIDIAKHVGLEKHKEDFGLALAYQGVPAGPYLVIPFIGPSNLRDGVGRIVDTALNPLNILYYSSNVATSTQNWVGFGSRTVEFVQTRADLIEAIETAKESSLDYYGFMQGAYYQYRRGLLYDGNPPVSDKSNVSDLDDDISWDDQPSESKK